MDEEVTLGEQVERLARENERQKIEIERLNKELQDAKKFQQNK